MLIGSIEAGGTKFVCAVGDEEYRIKDEIVLPTTMPEETLTKVIDYFKGYKLDSLSIASFGPIEIRKTAANYGCITTTPKAGWQNVNIVSILQTALDIPIFFTTDVNGAAYGEYIASKLSETPVSSLVYYTIGTGVGGGAILEGKIVGSLGHSEMGHVFVKRHPDDIEFQGICPYHNDCLEGLVSGPTFEARLSQKGASVSLENHVWDIMSYYVAQAAMQTTLILRPEKIVFGGGVTSEPFLKKVRKDLNAMLNGYVEMPNLDKYITMPMFANNKSATIGNFALGKKLIKSNK
ncbi:ROK family protein [Lactobacillus sp. ESL0681]|uniref:ROK family protein n=1 Tax=Lactobacillus sp. ESL0681 TaxID=2983211 RepID=UPI0023F9C233|nr:ROK family protein [Lactobacillus sp. ESL0681]WEV39629.1 ROK family protein [Lactobacillus sp. ESL0681]